MPALIPELITLANDPTVKTADLLRRALVAALSYGCPSGLPGLDTSSMDTGRMMPSQSYRHVQGEVLIDGHHGLKGVVFPSAEAAARWQLCHFDTPVDEIEGVVCRIRRYSYAIFLARSRCFMRAACGTNCTPLRRFTLASMNRILGAVRNQVF